MPNEIYAQQIIVVGVKKRCTMKLAMSTLWSIVKPWKLKLPYKTLFNVIFPPYGNVHKRLETMQQSNIQHKNGILNSFSVSNLFSFGAPHTPVNISISTE